MKGAKVMLVLLAALTILPVSARAESEVQRAWRDGFQAGYEMALERIANSLRDHAELLESIATWKELMVAGVLPPLRIRVSFEYVKHPDGSYQVVKRVSFEPPDIREVEQVAKFKRMIKEALDRVSSLEEGYWVVKNVKNDPLVDVAFYQFYARKQGLRPVLAGEKLVFGVYEREADARYVQKLLTSEGIPDVSVAYVSSVVVEKGKK